MTWRFPNLRGRRRGLEPPPLEPGEHVLWENEQRNKRFTFKVKSDNEFSLRIDTRMDAIGKDDPWLTKTQVRAIVEKIIALAKL
jgi:hypothetical protein